MEGPNEGFNINSGQWSNVCTVLILYNLHELRLELDNRGAIGWGLGKCNGRKLDDETKMKVKWGCGSTHEGVQHEREVAPKCQVCMV